MTVPNATFTNAILILDHTYDYIFQGIPSLNTAGYNVMSFSSYMSNHPMLFHYMPNRPTLLHYLPQPPHITPLHAPIAPYYSIICPNRPILLH
jgi:hypothetical protein